MHTLHTGGSSEEGERTGPFVRLVAQSASGQKVLLAVAVVLGVAVALPARLLW
jgi:hypothetical protein